LEKRRPQAASYVLTSPRTIKPPIMTLSSVSIAARGNVGQAPANRLDRGRDFHEAHAGLIVSPLTTTGRRRVDRGDQGRLGHSRRKPAACLILGRTPVIIRATMFPVSAVPPAGRSVPRQRSMAPWPNGDLLQAVRNDEPADQTLSPV
jgi:hypothetical protein